MCLQLIVQVPWLNTIILSGHVIVKPLEKHNHHLTVGQDSGITGKLLISYSFLGITQKRTRTQKNIWNTHEMPYIICFTSHDIK